MTRNHVTTGHGYLLGARPLSSYLSNMLLNSIKAEEIGDQRS